MNSGKPDEGATRTGSPSEFHFLARLVQRATGKDDPRGVCERSYVGLPFVFVYCLTQRSWCPRTTTRGGKRCNSSFNVAEQRCSTNTGSNFCNEIKRVTLSAVTHSFFFFFY